MSDQITTILSETKELRSQLEAATTHIGKLLQHAKLSWDSPENVRHGLRLLLSLAMFWLKVRGLYLNCSRNIGGSLNLFSDRTHGNAYDIQRKSGGGWGRGHSESERTLRTRDIGVVFPNAAQVNLASQLANWLGNIGRDLDGFYKQSEDLYRQLPTWLQIKKVCPFGGRVAYSCLLVVRGMGKLDNTLSNEHQLFGWYYVPEHTVDSLRIVRDSIVGRVRESSKGKAPSLKSGCHELSVRWATPNRLGMGSIPNNRRHDAKVPRLLECQHMREVFASRCLGNFERDSHATLWVTALHRCDMVGHKMVSRAFGLERDRITPTVITGRPVRVEGSTRDYTVPAMWITEIERSSQANYWQAKYGLVEGHLFIRKGWNDVYHADPSHDMSPSGIAETLDAASDYYFKWKREMELRALSDKERRAHERAQLAKLLRSIRSIPSFTPELSYRAGNCIPGTKDFIQRLGLSGESVSGTVLARKWREASYYGKDRFVGVVELALKASVPNG